MPFSDWLRYSLSIVVESDNKSLLCDFKVFVNRIKMKF